MVELFTATPHSPTTKCVHLGFIAPLIDHISRLDVSQYSFGLIAWLWILLWLKRVRKRAKANSPGCIMIREAETLHFIAWDHREVNAQIPISFSTTGNMYFWKSVVRMPGLPLQ